MIDPQDIVPVSELQDKLKPVLAHIRQTKQAVVITQRGKPAGVLLDVESYDRLVELAERAELEELIAIGEKALAAGDTVDWEEVKRTHLGWLQEK